MVKLSETERIEILLMVGYGDRQRSHQDVCHLFNNVHPERNPIVQSTVSKWVTKFRETVKDIPRSGRPKSATNQDQAIDVGMYYTYVMKNPIISTTQLALDDDFSQSVVRMLKKNKHKPYKIHLLLELNEDDTDRRMQFVK
jgi:hypothetical protein